MASYQQCVIVNPNAGKVPSLEELRQSLARLGEFQLFETAEAGDAARYARQALDDGCRHVIAGGGDGTIHEVLNGLAAGFDRVTLGILPLGTANDFARSIDVPAELEGAFDVILAGRQRTIDVVSLRAGDEACSHFLNVATGGFSALVKEKLDEDQGIKDWWRLLAYTISALKSLPELEEYHLRVRFDDDEPLDVPAYNLAVANGRFTGGAVPVAPQASLDDGLLDAVIYRVMPGPQIGVLVAQTMAGEHLDSEYVLFRRARRVEIDSQPQFSFNADGESTSCCPLRFEVLPRALNVFVGPEPPALPS